MSSDKRPVVWINGELHDPDTAGLSWSDHAITVGDGVFETIKLESGQPFALTRHLDRLEVSAAGLGLKLPDRPSLLSAVNTVNEQWGTDTGRLRITLTGGPGPMGSGRDHTPPTLMITAGALALSRDSAPVITVSYTRNERGALVGLKTISYADNVIALADAAEAGATEAIFANNRGELCEGTGSNVFLEHNGVLNTPPLTTGCLAGVTRALLIEALAASGVPVEETPLPLSALGEAREAFLASTGREAQPISAVNGTPLPTDLGELTRAAMNAWDSAYKDLTDP